MIRESAPAKLNLALHVRRRRADGYHELETLFAFVRDGDVLRFASADAPALAVTGAFAAGLAGEGDNLVERARRGFEAAFGPGESVAITLEKRLPVASGIGGGSADAAATLRGLARLRGIAPDDRRLQRCAEALGSDVPACLLGTTAVGRGRGERLQAVAGLAGTPALLVNPGIAVATPAVFARWDGADRGPLPTGAALAIAQAGRNDLEAAATALAPPIADVLTQLRHGDEAVLVRMSGSGATCFALYESEAARDRTVCALAAARPDWWQLATTLA